MPAPVRACAMFPEIEFWDDLESRSPADHMAIDEAMLALAKRPLLRAYRWAQPAVSFGYAQRLRDVSAWAPGLPAVRRWTGGGMVFHGRDLTLGLAIPTGFGAERKTSGSLYDEIHGAIRSAMESITPEIRLAGSADIRPGPQCFTSPAAGDLLAGAEKLCGGALRRTRSGVIYQGSIQWARLPDPAIIANAMGDHVVGCGTTRAIAETASELSWKKYSTRAWNELR